MKCGISAARGQLFLTLLLGAALAGPAQGDTITVYFDGSQVGGEHKGISQAQAIATGLEMMSVAIFSLDGALAIGAQSADGRVIPNGDPVPNLILNEMVVSNTLPSGVEFGADVYLLFATVQNFGGTTYNVDFEDEADEEHDRAGLMIDTDPNIENPWRIFAAEEDDVSFFYLGIKLSDFLTEQDGPTSCGPDVILAVKETCVALDYFLENPDAQLQGPMGGNQTLPLPKLGLLLAVVVPEPGTGSLLALGLLTLAASRRRHSR